ncbi:MAG: ATPase [Desulfurivibrio sp.]|nr:ATPase [Desulfurivibrio sp.]
MLIGDFGTSYSKILDLDQPATAPRVLPTRQLPPDTRVELATGHNARRFGRRQVNELVALARGGEALIERPDFLLLDCGSRDIKYIRYADHALADMGWNAECGASMGFTIELLERYYQLDPREMPLPRQSFTVTCGVLGLSDIFDAVINGIPEEEAVARLIRGIALNAHRFAGGPQHLYLSGGLCENPVFVNSLPCQVEVLGRFVLLEGLRRQLQR